MKNFFRIRWLLVIVLVYAAWRMIPRPGGAPEIIETQVQPEAAPTYAPLRIRPKKSANKESIIVETPTPDSVGIEPEPKMVATPRPLEAAGIFESVAFKDEEEVLGVLGEADATYEQEGRVSWYYAKTALTRQGKPVCPEIRFVEDQARMVIMWPPDKMQKQIDLVRRLKAEQAQGPKGPATFTFSDTFKYLGVGTPQETVLEDIGEPDSRKTLEGREEWNYDTLIIENGASRRLTVVIQKGKVVEVRGR